MALPSTVYRATIRLSDTDRGIYETIQTTLARHPSETAERLVLRLLAYCVSYRPDLAFTKGICAGDEPDLWVKSPDGRISLWVEVGTPEPERLVKAARHAGRVLLLASGANRFRWHEQNLEKIAAAPNIAVLGLDFALVRELAGSVERSISWEVTVAGGTIYITSGETTVEAPLEHLSGEPGEEWTDE